jgi:hypothetical protein
MNNSKLYSAKFPVLHKSLKFIYYTELHRSSGLSLSVQKVHGFLSLPYHTDYQAIRLPYMLFYSGFNSTRNPIAEAIRDKLES